MQSGGGHRKGASFERVISRALSRWLTKGARDDLFWRSAMSGGRATLQLREDIINLAQSGDITAISPQAYELAERCFFELKTYKNLEIGQSLIKGTGVLYRFWQITKREAYRYGKTPVLIAKQNNFPVILLCPIDSHAFNGHPMIEHLAWDTAIYLFDTATDHAASTQGSAVRGRERLGDQSVPFRRRVTLD